MADTITTGIFGTLIVAILVYLVARVDRLEDHIDRLTLEVHALAERVSRIEGRLDERDVRHPR